MEMKAGLVLWLLLLGYVRQVSAGNSAVVEEDDYCDLADGGDESRTSACSSVHSLSGQRPFLCRGSLNLRVHLPTSRVGDGICDCCDGEDEEGGLWGVECPNTCKRELLYARQVALSNYTNVKRGREMRNDMKFTVARKHLQRDTDYKEAKKDLAYMKKAHIDLRILYVDEYTTEADSQFKLLRGKLNLCASGIEEACALWGDDEPRALERSVSPWETKTRVSNTTWHELSVRDRLRTSRCYYDVLWDETRKNHTTVGAYVGFMKSQGGKNLKHRRRWTVSLMRRKGLFGPFLEFGDEGHLRFKMFVCEMLGLVLLPATFPLRVLVSYVDEWLLSLLQSARLCSDDTLSCSRTAQDLSTRWLKSVDKESGFPKALDYEKSRLAMGILGPIQPYLATPRWISRIVWMAPTMYYEYYMDPSKYERLPQRRQACICREGMRVVESEMDILEDKIRGMGNTFKEEQETKLIEAATHTSMRDFGPDKLWKSVDGAEIANKLGVYTYKLVFFKDIWQGDVMIGSFSNWGDAFVRKVNQERKLTFLQTCWYQSYQYVADSFTSAGRYWWAWFDKAGVDMQELSDSVLWIVGLLYSSRLPAENPDASSALYRAQFYSGGDQCFNGPRRSAVVYFVCATDNTIEDVTEVQTCVYDIRVGTPLACTEATEERALSRMEELDVYGYSKSKAAAPELSIVDENDNTDM